MKKKIFYYFHALVTLKLSQLAFYVYRRGVPDWRRYEPGEIPTVNPKLTAGKYLEYPMNGGGGWKFRFLNQTREFPAKKPDWSCHDMPRLWRYNLHYFDFLQDPEIESETKDFLVKDWIKQNPLGTVTAWEPYTLSLRLVNWIKYLESRKELAENREVVASLTRQALWLSGNLEKHILANHYFKNIKALYFAGLYLEGTLPEKWLKSASRLLEKQLYEQSCSDGGHYERSPMYHSIYLEDLLDLCQFNQNSCKALPFDELLRTKALQAALFLRDMRMPNGRLPLFNDAAYGIAPEPSKLLEYASKTLNIDVMDTSAFPEQTAFDDTGYFVLGDDSNRMIIDCGETAPRFQPGHTHCDTLSFELAIDRTPVVVDTGTHDYEPGKKRQYDRSTAAHNTVVVDSEEQSEVWGLFRVARRASPVHCSFESTETTSLFVGAHDGYQRLQEPVLHKRAVSFEKGTGWCVEDTLEGKGHHYLDSFIHLHPDIQAEIDGNTLSILGPENDRLAKIEVTGDVEVNLQDSVYHPQFGVELKIKVIRIQAQGSLPVCFGYNIRLEKAEP